MIAKLFEVRETADKGKGLFAKEFIPKGTIVCFECNKCRTLKDIDPSKMSVEEKEKMFDYAYRKKDGSYIAPCDETRYLNHSCNANILGTEFGFDIAVRDIQKGEEMTYDYRDFYDDIKMACNCGEENCCRAVTFEHPVPQALQKFWKEKTDAALELANKVEQPLKEELKENGINIEAVLSRPYIE